MKTLFVFVVLAVGAAAFWYVASTRKQPESAPVAVAPNSVAPDAVAPADDRPLGVILRARARWPMTVSLTKERVLKFDDGEMTLPVGRKFRATMLTDDGRLLGSIGERSLSIPFEETDFLDALAAAETEPPQSANPVVERIPTRPAALRVAPEKRLAELKAKFPPAERRKAEVRIKNPRPDRNKPTQSITVAPESI